jgi:hypothetical protein
MDTILLLVIGVMFAAGVALGIRIKMSHKRKLSKVRHHEFWDKIHNR